MLKYYRERKGISQNELAHLTNLDRKTIFRIENDISSPLIENYAKIVVALGLSDIEIGQHIRELAYCSKKNIVKFI